MQPYILLYTVLVSDIPVNTLAVSLENLISCHFFFHIPALPTRNVQFLARWSTILSLSILTGNIFCVSKYFSCLLDKKVLFSF